MAIPFILYRHHRVKKGEEDEIWIKVATPSKELQDKPAVVPRPLSKLLSGNLSFCLPLESDIIGVGSQRERESAVVTGFGWSSSSSVQSGPEYV